eukprot:Plantae.Rhodophyta-Purpureofilum_apyrenoidigerum.ctg19984.p1 GENE.Plantae.Rhodophyta-Purpureofilum_apyrenoidigerum.ctg19984~~Plantae.Rhodophyta-Purpureofilum_apyrenoidigerum.ctg19984.p1  ORF type:complete len:133 (-),score=8.31 Plantae.Rhodophyta-Purpureofilum_apyrenoidigerum.ctg19984:195-593(-)
MAVAVSMESDSAFGFWAFSRYAVQASMKGEPTLRILSVTYFSRFKNCLFETRMAKFNAKELSGVSLRNLSCVFNSRRVSKVRVRVVESSLFHITIRALKASRGLRSQIDFSSTGCDAFGIDVALEARASNSR